MGDYKEISDAEKTHRSGYVNQRKMRMSGQRRKKHKACGQKEQFAESVTKTGDRDGVIGCSLFKSVLVCPCVYVLYKTRLFRCDE